MPDLDDREVSDFDIAIVGAAGRFPGASDLERYWGNLIAGRESITRFDDDELLAAGVSPALIADPGYVKAAPVLEEPGRFDAAFFGYSPRDATLIDPQQRQLLELAWLAFEDAAIVPGGEGQRVATYAGTAMNTYLLSTALAGRFFDDWLPVLLGADKDFQATRIAFKLGLTGPALSVQSACSTSLVAVHLACQSLINRESDLALAAAAAVRCPPTSGHLHEPNSVLTPDGHCRPFDDAAAGTIFGSGGGTVLLKRLRDALDDGDPIRAIIKGSAINNDGDSKADYTAPTVHRQAEAIGEALGSADVSAETIGYVEAHGTGTFLGDPIEVAALTRAFRGDTERTGFCGLGSVKGNIGHLDAAAGMASLLKMVLSMEYGRLAPTANFTAPNSQIDFAATPFRVVTAAEDWNPPEGLPRRGGVTSLGMGGTNAHVVLEEAPPRAPRSSAETPRACLLPLSARDDAALGHRVADLARHLDGHPELALDDIAHTLGAGRRSFARRCVAVASTTREAAERLGAPDRLRVVGTPLAPREREIAMLFPGQGAQHVDMGRRLHEREPVFRDALDRVAEVLREPLGLDLRDVLFGGGARTESASIDETRLTQPALFAIEWAYLELWRSRGVEPDVFIGHSIGEYVAAVGAGVFDVEDAARLVAERGRLMQSARRGAMLAVHRPEAEVVADLPKSLDVAVVNAADAVVVAGEHEAISAYARTLAESGVKATKLRTSHAFHSRMMEPVLDAFEAAVSAVERRAPNRPFVSNTSGTWITDAEAIDSRYWAEHVRRAVRFDAGLATLLARGELVAIEAGPGTTLATLFNQHEGRDEGRFAVSSAPPRKADLDEEEAALLAFGQLWCSGREIAWPTLASDTPRRVSLPGYRFGGKTHWFERANGAADMAAAVTDAPRREGDPARWVRAESWTPVGDERLRERIDGPTLLVGTPGDGDALRLALPEAATCDPDLARGTDGYRGFVDRLERDGVPARLVVDVRGSAPDEVFLKLVHLVQALARWDGVRTIALDIVTGGALDTLGDGVTDPGGALAIGVAEVARKEWPHVRTRVIDIGPSGGAPGESAGRDATALARVLAARGGDAVIGVRDGRPWARQAVSAPLAHAPSDGRGGVTPAAGAHVIVGGFGGIGRRLARRLVERGAHVVLTHRPTASGESERRAFVDELAPLGGRIGSAPLDLDDDVDARELFTRLSVDAPLAAVYHLAGRTDDAPLSSKGDEAMLAVLAAKVDGTRVLDAALGATRGTAPLVLFSSVAAWSGPVGQVDYAAANAYQMAFARTTRPHAHPVVAIAWPGWRRTGMVARIGDEGARRLVDSHGVEPTVALDVLEAVLEDGRATSWVSPLPLDLLETPLVRDVTASHADATTTDGNGETASAEDRVARHWRALLGFDDIGPDENYFDLGGTSLVAVKLCGRLEREFDVPLAVEELLAAPTIAALGALLERRVVESGVQASAAASDPETVNPIGSANAASGVADEASIVTSTLSAVPTPTLSSDENYRDDAPASVRQAERAKSDGAAARPSLVPIAAAAGEVADAVPVYLVHAHGGMVIGYRKLAQEIARHRPVFGLQSRGIRGDEAPLERIEEMAEHYAREIVAHRPEGPWVIGGYCMGGTIAWEVARCLEANGHPAALVFMLQSFHRDLEYPIVQNGRTAYPSHVGAWRRLTLFKDKAVEALVRHVRGSEGTGSAFGGLVRGSMRRLRRTLARSGERRPVRPGLNTADEPALLAVHAANGRAFYDYDPASLGSAVSFYPAAHQPRHVRNDPMLGWQRLVGGPVNIRPVPGSFLIGLDGLDLASVANHLERDMATALGTGGRTADTVAADVGEREFERA